MNPFFEAYADRSGRYDELTLGTGTIRPHWQDLIRYLSRQDDNFRERVQHDIRQLLRDNGVTYNLHGDPDAKPRLWQLDTIPLIMSEADWEMVDAGIKQRATLLNELFKDIYGEQRLIKAGLLPWELIYSHSGLLRPMMGVTYRHNPLSLYAADLGRGPDNRMWVLEDRTQAPSGAGYALENRMVMSRVLADLFKDGKIRRLSNFFRHLQNSLYEMAATRTDTPQVGILTPGPFNETYFEHAYLASYLGFMLVQGHDLTVRDGQVWLKTIEGLQPIDVLLRRIDDAFCDPLELLDYSQLGVAGLVEAVRRQNVSIANGLGAGVLENPGLMPFLPNLAQEVLGEDLILPSAATWWCGQPKELGYVLDNLESLVIKNISNGPGARTLFGAELSRSEREALVARIQASPGQYVGQEQVSFSTVPSLVKGAVKDEVEHRYTILRTFAVAHTAQTRGYSSCPYEVMPGGLTRSSASPGSFVVSSNAGGISRDTWVLTDQPDRDKTLWLNSEPERLLRSFKQSFTISSREAENLFWVGRYAERTESTARLLRTILDLYFHVLPAHDAAEIASFEKLLQALTHLTLTYPGFVGGEGVDPAETEALLTQPEDELLALMLDDERAGSLVFNLRSMVNAAYAVRNQWSVDTWPVIEQAGRVWSNMSKVRADISFQQLREQLNTLLIQIRSFSGYLNESMTQGLDWRMLDIGVRIERAQMTISLVRAAFAYETPREVELDLLENVLVTTDNIITYRRRYKTYIRLETVLEQVLLDPTSPRSLVFQLEKLQTLLKDLPREIVGYRMSSEEKEVMSAIATLRMSDIAALLATAQNSEEGVAQAEHGPEGTAAADSDDPSEGASDPLFRAGFDQMLGELTGRLNEISLLVSRYYFTHAEVPQPLMTLPLETDDFDLT